MSNIKFYKLDAVGDSVQFGKTGGFASYLSLTNEFVFKQNDSTSTAVVQAAGFTAVNDNIRVLDPSKTISIDDGTISRDSSSVLKFDSSAAVIIPVGSNAARPTGKIGMIRINTESTPFLETYNGSSWQNISSSSTGGADTQIQYNSNGTLAGSSRFSITFSEVQASTTINLGDPSSYSSTSSVAYLSGKESTDSKQGTTVQLRGGNNSGTGSGGSAVISGGYSITAGTYAGNVVLMGGESSVGNHGSVYVYTIDNSSGSAERLKIAGGTGAWGLGGENYGSAGQVLTSSGYNAPPVWSTVSGTVKVPFAFNMDQTLNLFIVPTNSVVLSITIVITTAFNDSATTLQVGDAAVTDRLMSAQDSLPNVAGSYTVYPNYVYGIGTQLVLTTTGSSTAGEGVVVISYE